MLVWLLAISTHQDWDITSTYRLLKRDTVLDSIINSIRKSWLSHLVLLLYIILIFIVIFNHEQWADEAQAWLLARDSGLFELLFENLRYEGHPPLWHLLLMLPSRFLPYRAVSIISALIAIVGVYILLHYSSFPKIVKLLLPFSYFIFYQYGVIARNYVLIPLLLFLIASVYKHKAKRIYQFTILVCLLANTSIFTTLIALSIMFVHLIDLVRARSQLGKELIIRQVKAYIAFAIVIGLIVVQLWQPEDSSFARGYNLSIKRFLELSPRILDESMTEISYVSGLVLIVSLVWFWQTKMLLLYLLSTLSVLSLFSVKYYNSWHQGIIFLTWIFVIWLSFQNQDNMRLAKLSGWVRRLVILSSLLVLGSQIYWAASVSISDFRGTYSAGEAVSRYIKENELEDKKIYATGFWTTAVLPYFDGNIFDNHNDGQKPAFWLWSDRRKRIEDLEAILRDQPDLIIIARPPSDLKEIGGYRFVGIFEGNLYWKNRIKEKNDLGVFHKY